MSYTKLFNSIVTSTIWNEDDRTRIVWITMLAMADRNGEVMGSVPGIARIAGVPVEDCRKAMQKFLEPDPDSRTKDDEGRRIEEIDGGWHLLNHQKYRDMATDEDRRTQAAVRQQRAREKKARNKQESRDSHATVTPESRQIPQAEADTDADVPSASAEGGAGGTAIAAPASAGKKTRKAEPITEGYLTELQAKYTWANVRQEFTKASTWCDSKNKTCSRLFFVNWLNRVSPPPTANGTIRHKSLQQNAFAHLTGEEALNF